MLWNNKEQYMIIRSTIKYQACKDKEQRIESFKNKKATIKQEFASAIRLD